MMDQTDQKKKILIVEDEKFYSRTLSYKLESVGFDIVLANDGKEALAALEQDTFDLLLTDLVMPNMNGFELIKEVKKRGLQMPVMALTNLSQEEDKKVVLDSGASDYIVKAETPIFELVKRIEKILSVSKS